MLAWHAGGPGLNPKHTERVTKEAEEEAAGEGENNEGQGTWPLTEAEEAQVTE